MLLILVVLFIAFLVPLLIFFWHSYRLAIAADGTVAPYDWAGPLTAVATALAAFAALASLYTAHLQEAATRQAATIQEAATFNANLSSQQIGIISSIGTYIDQLGNKEVDFIDLIRSPDSGLLPQQTARNDVEDKWARVDESYRKWSEYSRIPPLVLPDVYSNMLTSLDSEVNENYQRLKVDRNTSIEMIKNGQFGKVSEAAYDRFGRQWKMKDAMMKCARLKTKFGHILEETDICQIWLELTGSGRPR